MTRIRRLAAALSSDSGFTMIVALGVLLVSSLLLSAAFVAAEGDIHLTHSDTLAKDAYYAAQAGVDDYSNHLILDGNYLINCASPVPENPALNQLSEKATHKATVPGTETNPVPEKYAIDLVPAENSSPAGEKTCNKANVAGSMIEQTGPAAGTFRIKSTGFAQNKQRTITATFKNLNFVSFVWFSVFETADPVVYGEPPAGEPKKYLECGKFYGERPNYCSQFDNFFISGESVNGPMHTEDHAGICGSPVFGRKEADRIEFGHAFEKDEGFSNEGCGQTASPTFKGTHIAPSKVPSLKPPPGDEELAYIVEPAYQFSGKTEVILEGTKMKIIEHKGAGAPSEVTKENVAFPEAGVIYVEGGCAEPYSPFGPKPGYSQDTACGNVYVHGKYELPLTIASQNDVIINGNITTTTNAGVPTGSSLLGLIANNFVRLYHPLIGVRKSQYTECGTSSEAPGDLKEPEVYAAVLALKHALVVDNFDCGEPNLGKFNLYGAVAGLFSNGMTGVFSGASVIHGYPYNLNYDNRLLVSEPPHFLNPIQAAWYVQRETLSPAP